MTPVCISCQLPDTETGGSHGSWPWDGGWTFRLVLGLDGAALPGAWSELLTAFIIVKHLSVECTSGELSLGTDPGTS